MTVAFVAGDTAATLRVQCMDEETGEPVDLSGATVELRWRIAGRPMVTRSMVIVDAAEGLAEYEFAANELRCGELRADVVITRTAGTLTCREPVVADVRARV